MSRFVSLAKGKTQYVYGYDRVLDYYFLSREFANGNWRNYVGLLSDVAGTADNLLKSPDAVQLLLQLNTKDKLVLDWVRPAFGAKQP